MQIFKHGQVNARTALGDFRSHAVEAFFQQQRIVDRKVSIAGGHIAFPLIMPVASSAFARR